tara:strand:- start:1907 stop:2455 length:549 start_codon:yes stop_codon:yes gene_type:complete
MNKTELRELVERTDARTLSRIIEKGGKFDDMKNELEAKASETWSRRAKDKFKTRFYSIFSAVIGVALLLGCLVGCPQYGVYKSGLQGKAELVKAEQNKKIQIENAKGKLNAAQMLAEADSIRAIGAKNVEKIRAQGMAEAMEIENGKLTQQYIQYLWVRNIDKGDKIYISTEAGLPILEAKQ